MPDVAPDRSEHSDGHDAIQASRHPLVSVIIPVFDDAAHLPRAINSVLGQEPNVHELVIVDDGSTDGSSEIAERACADPRVRVVHQANQGPGSAANAGLAQVSGTHVLLVDSDDWLVDGAISVLLRQVDHADPDVVSFAASVVDAQGDQVTDDHHYAKPDIPEPVSGVEYYSGVQANGWVTASSKTYLWRRAYLERIKLRVPETYIYEDEYFTPVAILCATSITSTSQALYVRMNRPGSLTMRPLSASNTDQRVTSAALLRHAVGLVSSVAGPRAGRLIRDRSRRLARAALVEAETMGTGPTALDLIADRLGGTGPDALGIVGWLMGIRIRAGVRRRSSLPEFGR